MSRLAKNSVPSRYLIKCKKESGKNKTLPKAQWFQSIYEIAIEFLIFLRFDNIFFLNWQITCQIFDLSEFKGDFTKIF